MLKRKVDSNEVGGSFRFDILPVCYIDLEPTFLWNIKVETSLSSKMDPCFWPARSCQNSVGRYTQIVKMHGAA